MIRRSRTRSIRWAAAAALAVALAGCASYPPYPAMPPATIEVMGKPPVTETPLIWQPGHWDWAGSAYTWQPGIFVPRSGHSDYFVSGVWEPSNGDWQWHPAHWMP